MRTILVVGALWLAVSIVTALAIAAVLGAISRSSSADARRHPTAAPPVTPTSAAAAFTPPTTAPADALTAVAVSLHGVLDNALLAREATVTLADDQLPDEARREVVGALVERTALVVELLGDVLEWAPDGLVEKLERQSDRPLPTVETSVPQPSEGA